MLNSFTRQNGVFLSEAAFKKFRDFENAYLKVRSEESRVMSDEIVRALPQIPNSHPDHLHWKTRRYNIGRFLNYTSRKKNATVLDVGCGNGFLSHLIADQGHRVTGVDVNLHELKQAARLFNRDNLDWYCADMLHDGLPGPYNLILFFCSIQYFSDLTEVIRRCKLLLAENGEIHIIDSPFYKKNEVFDARKRSQQYYQDQNAGEMVTHYHHHTWEELEQFKPKFLYRPGWKNKIIKDSPFCWIKIS